MTTSLGLSRNHPKSTAPTGNKYVRTEVLGGANSEGPDNNVLHLRMEDAGRVGVA